MQHWGPSLDGHWLRLPLPMQGVCVRSLVRELRSHVPQGQKPPKYKIEQHCNKFHALKKIEKKIV